MSCFVSSYCLVSKACCLCKASVGCKDSTIGPDVLDVEPRFFARFVFFLFLRLFDFRFLQKETFKSRIQVELTKGSRRHVLTLFPPL